MQESLKNSPQKNYQWLDIVETLSVVGSVGGSIAAAVTNQVALASIPLSVTVMLNLVNRRMQIEAINQNHQSAIAQLIAEDVKTLAKVETNSEQIADLQQLTFDYKQVRSNVLDNANSIQSNKNAIAQIVQERAETEAKLIHLSAQIEQLLQNSNSFTSSIEEHSELLQNNQIAIAELLQEQEENKTKFNTLIAQLTDIQEIIPILVEGNSNLMDYKRLQDLYEEQLEVVKKVDCLRQIEAQTQAIWNASNKADAYYQRGLNYQGIGNQKSSIVDFTEAIRLNLNHAQAYYHRGLASAKLGNKKQAVQDLREAAKLFFEEGDIANYQTARDMTKQLHELNSQADEHTTEQVAVGNLFSGTF